MGTFDGGALQAMPRISWFKKPILLFSLSMGAVIAEAQPVITVQPVSQTVNLGGSATFSVTATDANPIGYQWQFNGTAIDMATGATLTLSDLGAPQAGSYTVYVYDSAGGVTSTAATLTIAGGPVITSSLTLSAYSQTFPFYYTVTGTNSPTQFGATGLPPGLSMDPLTGVISGTPTANGVYSVDLSATNSSGVGTATLTLTITEPPYYLYPLSVTTPVPFSNLTGIVSGGSGIFYLADSGNNIIYRFDSGKLAATVYAGTSGVAGTSDGVGTAAAFNGPTALAIDGSGNIYVADTASSTIRKISSTGSVTTLAGVPGEPGTTDGPANSAHFNYPQGVAVDAAGNVYVADTGNHTIRQISTGGTVTTIAGTAGSTRMTDGTGASAQFINPLTLVFDSKGILYILDSFNGIYGVRTLDTSLGTVKTLVTQSAGIFSDGSDGSLAIDSSDNLFLMIAESRNAVLEVVSTSGVVLSQSALLNSGGYYGAVVPNATVVDQSGQIIGTSKGSLIGSTFATGATITNQPTIVESTIDLDYPNTETLATISVGASSLPQNSSIGGPALYYQWFLDGNPIQQPNIPGDFLTPPSGSFETLVNANTVGTYSVLITDEYGGAVLSDGVFLSFTPQFSVLCGPVEQAVALGSDATFVATTAGTVAPAYQWNFNGTPIPGATCTSYTVSDAVIANSGAYSVTVIDQGYSVSSQPCFLTVSEASGGPSIEFQPQSLTVNANETVVLGVSLSSPQVTATSSHVEARAASADTFQWYFNGSPLTDGNGISGSQTSTLVLSGSGASAGSYSCLIENSAGSVFTFPATLALSQTTDIGRLTNVSCRALVGTGSDILIAGFIVGGSGTSGSEPFLVRASGPALVPFDVTGTLSDPELELFNTTSGTALVASNAGWAGSPQVTSTAASVGAFAWASPTSHDAALVESLASGQYTANVSGETGDTGVALAEVYDAAADGEYTPTNPRLVNISARVRVGTGSDSLIAGFVIGGSTSKTVLVRASGPALGQFDVAGTLPDPELQLYKSNGDGTSNLLASNTGWGGDVELAAVAASVGAFSWGTSATPDSAILLTLPPGAYTAQVSGASGDTGIALVEVYEVQ
jgi:sugar lactone lactonase YvrE